jgi:hypothetical protein
MDRTIFWLINAIILFLLLITGIFSILSVLNLQNSPNYRKNNTFKISNTLLIIATVSNFFAWTILLLIYIFGGIQNIFDDIPSFNIDNDPCTYNPVETVTLHKKYISEELIFGMFMFCLFLILCNSVLFTIAAVKIYEETMDDKTREAYVMAFISMATSFSAFFMLIAITIIYWQIRENRHIHVGENQKLIC